MCGRYVITKAASKTKNIIQKNNGVVDEINYNAFPLSSNVDNLLFNINHLQPANSLCATNVYLTIHFARFSYACVTIAIQ